MTARPTPEFRRHHDVEAPRVDERAFRQGWIVRTRLDQLLADDRISREQWHAASEFRVAWGIAREISTPEPGAMRIASSASGDAGAIARLDAETRLRVVEDAIGRFRTALVVACVVVDLPWAVTARFSGRHPETVRDWTVLAIRALAGAWAGPGRTGGARPSSDSREDPTAL